jgi:hypothetical protein
MNFFTCLIVINLGYIAYKLPRGSSKITRFLEQPTILAPR